MKLPVKYFYYLFAISILTNGCSDENEQLGSVDVQENSLVSTPFGDMAKSQVYLIEDGYAVKVENGHLLKYQESTGKTIQDLGELGQPKNQISGRVKSNDPWDSTNDIVDCTLGNNLNYTNFSASITVPAAATQNTETLYLGISALIFTPFQSKLYTVLQYGPSAAGGGQYWSAACWQLFNGIATHTALTTNIAPGTVLGARIQYLTNQYKAYFTNYSGSITYTTPITSSRLGFWLGGYPKTTGAYPNQFSSNFTDVKVQTGSTYPTLNWSPSPSGSFGERFKVVSNSNTIGQVNLCFYGNPYNLNYPNNTVFPISMTWTGPPRAVSYVLEYTVSDHYGNNTTYTGTSNTTSFTFPFTFNSCRGCDLNTRVSAVFAGGVVSEYASYNTLL